MRRSRLNLALLLLVATLGLLVWLSPERESKNSETRLTRLNPEEIQTVRISNRNGPPFTLRRRAEGWWMSEPYVIAADAARIALLLKIASAPVLEQFTVTEAALPEFGLAPPKARLQLDDLELNLGDTHPLNHNRYIAIGRNLSLIKDIFPHHLLAGAEGFISPRLLPANVPIDAIVTPDWQLTRQPQDKQVWKLNPPESRLSLDRLVEKVDDWKQARALRVQRASKPPAAEPKEVILQLGGQTLRFVVLPQPTGTLLLRQDLGIAYELPTSSDLLTNPTGNPP